ncbi:hypothetical protein UNDKW_0899 [Undibacterium sp. KW1]|nr:hypothetical protein UNDKW_0899 [Undibacterium sp. KW1]
MARAASKVARPALLILVAEDMGKFSVAPDSQDSYQAWDYKLGAKSLQRLQG